MEQKAAASPRNLSSHCWHIWATNNIALGQGLAQIEELDMNIIFSKKGFKVDLNPSNGKVHHHLCLPISLILVLSCSLADNTCSNFGNTFSNFSNPDANLSQLYTSSFSPQDLQQGTGQVIAPRYPMANDQPCICHFQMPRHAENTFL